MLVSYICIVHLFLGSDDVPAGFITHNKTLIVCRLEEQAWRLYKQQESVPVCKEKEQELSFWSELHL